MQHKYDPSTYRCIQCGAGIYTTGTEDCPGKMETEESEQERIWKAIRNFS